MHNNDRVRMRHMLDAAQEARLFVAGRSRSDLEVDRQLTLALVKDIEIIGEAASRVSDECRQRYAAIPWQNIVAMRNRLIHGYFDINLDVVWATVSQELAPLIGQLEQALEAYLS